ncbi:G-protein coupled receptor family C group 6 member A [Apodemus speciosus]|uniref:G-protein coupled receptor family C group 6 member A n=1 Tax=Apodemus speciosus TaxID=105296 RepID=A0ABQ0F7K5_APOSI
MLICHALNFASTGFFIGEPQDFGCKARQTLFGVSFTLCVSCILTKSLKILLAFSFDPKLTKFLKCLYRPVPIVLTCTGIQVVICTLWLVLAAPTVEENISLPRSHYPGMRGGISPGVWHHAGLHRSSGLHLLCICIQGEETSRKLQRS